jgi:hypothetical protein
MGMAETKIWSSMTAAFTFSSMSLTTSFGRAFLKEIDGKLSDGIKTPRCRRETPIISSTSVKIRFDKWKSYNQVKADMRMRNALVLSGKKGANVETKKNRFRSESKFSYAASNRRKREFSQLNRYVLNHNIGFTSENTTGKGTDR